MDFNDLFGDERYHLIVTTLLSSIDKPLVIGLPVHNGNKYQCKLKMPIAKDEYEIALPYVDISVNALKSPFQTGKPPIVHLSSQTNDFRQNVISYFIPSKRDPVFLEKIIEDLANDYKKYPIDMFKSDWEDVFGQPFKKSKSTQGDRVTLSRESIKIWPASMLREYWQDKICGAYSTEEMVMSLYAHPEVKEKTAAKEFARFTELWVLEQPTKKELTKARKDLANLLEAAYAVDPILFMFHWGTMKALLEQ